MLRSLALLAAFAVTACSGAVSPAKQSVESQIHATLEQYLATRGKIEHISAIAVSVSPPRGSASDINVAAGTTTYGGSTPAQALQLVQIGSNTKAYTAVLLLHLEAAGKLSINDPLSKWLPQYPAWGRITIRQLLNMTSGIPTYDDSLRMQKDWSANPYRQFTPMELIAYVYPKVDFAPGKRWMYSNTAYILSQLIVERITGNSYAGELRKLLGPLGLHDTYYSDHIYPAAVLARMPSGYFWNRGPGNEGLKPLLGRDTKPMSVSWAQGAGAIVASLPDVDRWSRDLFRGSLLAPRQRAEMTSLVSLKTGQSVPRTSSSDPRAFGLGVAQLTAEPLGTMWFYEGETVGYRTAFAYLPKSDAVLAVSLNSQPDGNQDHINKLMTDLYAILKPRGLL
jgi:D-alanyl-D-alanine carboxypeptidase